MNKDHFSDTVRRELMETLECESHENIRKNYLKLALKYHPDKNPQGLDTFHKIRENYELLTDEQKFREHVNSLWRDKNIRDIIKFFEMDCLDNPLEVRKAMIDNIMDILYHPWEIPYELYAKGIPDIIHNKKEPIRLIITNEDTPLDTFIDNYYKVFKIYTIEEHLYNNFPSDNEITFLLEQI